MVKKQFLLPFILCNTLLTGCSTTSDNNPTTKLDVEHQQQLAALIAGSQYLKENCQRNDIPAISALTKTAILEAKNKKWPVNETLSDALPLNAREIINKLNQDPTPVAQKCAYFNSSLAAFIEASRRQ